MLINLLYSMYAVPVMLARRQFLAVAAAARIPSRPAGKVETVFKTPGPQPNGLQATTDGLWIMDQGDNRVYLVAYESGKVLRAFDTEANAASGITFDGQSLWLASTYSREIIRCDAATGKTISKHTTPGAGLIYKMAGDPAARSSPVPRPPRPANPARQAAAAACTFPPSQNPGTGAHGMEWRDGKLWVAVPPARSVYRIDPQSWQVEQKWSTSGNRPHGIGWDGKWLWVTDSNYNAFFKHDPATGEVAERIQLADSDPLPHGMTIWKGTIWYCDDVGLVCRLKL
jgi:sugar lactone lactonase YvrE